MKKLLLAAALLATLTFGTLGGSPARKAPHWHTVVLFSTLPERNNNWAFEVDCLSHSDFDRNPVLLVDHQLSATAIIGRVANIRVDGDQLLADIDFLDRPDGWEGSWLPDALEAAFAAGVGAVSIHVEVLDKRTPTPDDHLKYGPLVESVVTSASLIELSVVAVGAFPDAIPTAR